MDAPLHMSAKTFALLHYVNTAYRDHPFYDNIISKRDSFQSDYRESIASYQHMITFASFCLLLNDSYKICGNFVSLSLLQRATLI